MTSHATPARKLGASAGRYYLKVSYIRSLGSLFRGGRHTAEDGRALVLPRRNTAGLIVAKISMGAPNR